MTNDQKKVATGAISGIFLMLTGILVLPGILGGLEPDAAAGERLAYAVKWIALGTLPLALMIAAVGNARFGSEAIDPTAGKESPAMIINGRVVDNSVQQYLLFAAASLAVAASARGDQLGVVAAGAIMFVVLRFAFWIGYRIKPVYRATGFAGTFYLNVALFAYAIWLTWFA